MTAQRAHIITPAGLKAGRKPPTGWYITQDRQTLINIDKDGWINCYSMTGDAQPIRLTDIDISAEPLYEATCDED